MAATTSGLAQTSGLLREVYSGISGSTVADLLNSPSFPDNPTSVGVISSFEAPANVDDNYGQRVSGYLIPPTTGNYVFWISSDDDSSLRLSTDSNPANVSEIASVSGWTDARQWTKYPEQVSGAIRLVAGQKYFIQALMKEGSGGDNLAVRWQLPDSTIEEPIPGTRLQVYGLSAPVIVQQPANVTVTESGNATFSVKLQWGFGASYQWQRGTVNIPGATNSVYSLTGISLSDNGATFRCAITNSQGSSISSPATLTVQRDVTAPTLSSVANLGDNTIVTVLYSKPVEAVTATNRLNYGINNGVTITSVTFGSDSQSVVLKTSPLSQGVTYTVTVNNVRDRATYPNTIAPNTQASFSIDYTPLDIAKLSLNREPIGPSSRHTGLVISEIMYHPTNRPDGKELEFIELYNSQVNTVDLSGYRFSGDIDYTFPTNTTLASGAYLVVAPVPGDIQSVYGISGVLGGFTNRLSNGSGMLRLRNRFDAVLLEAHYSGDSPWPVAANGTGHSLVLARPSYGEANPEAWEASDLVGGTPGSADTSSPNPYASIVINEFLAHTDDPEVDYIELFNYSSSPVNLTGCTLSDHPVTNRFVLPNITIPANGFVVFNQTNMGFGLSAAGETIYLKNPSGTKVIDAVSFKGQENGVATGRYPDGAPGFYRLQTKTPGAPNGPVRLSNIVLNEILYKPISGSSDDEYVELYNRGTNSINLGGWKLSDAISFTFPTNAVIPAGGYVVIANKAAHLMTNYASLNANNTFGNISGSLPSGGRIALTMPDQVQSTNGSTVVTNTIHITVDEVTYGTGGRWGEWAAGGGSSLESIDAHSNHRLPSNWADSDESSKSGWTNVEFTGILDNGTVAPDAVHIFLQGSGECLVDNVEVVTSGGVNLVTNPDFEKNTAGWYFQGVCDQSYWQTTGGYNGGKCLHVIATGRGDTGANHVRGQLTTAATAGDTVTLRAKVRWLKGNPEILIRLHGNWLEAYGNIAGARYLGTPGLPNSRAKTNAGPAIHDVSHSPILPADGQDVEVRAQVSDPDGLSSLILKYRLDPATNYSAVSMTYRGAGIYTATIPGQPAGSLVAFAIQAADDANPPVTTFFPNNAPARECLVRFGEPIIDSGHVGSYHFWITQATNDRWTSREHNSNETLDSTFVYGNSRVVYNIGAMYSGSPWHTPGYNGPLNNICDYVLVFPDDDLLLGVTDYVLASLGNLNNDDTAQREQAAFWMLGELGCPTLYRHYINVFVNGLQRGLVYEDAQQPSSDIVTEWFPDDNNGDLHKVEDWFEFDPSGDAQASQTDATLGVFTTSGGAKKLARYRWNWRKRAVKTSANDYASLFTLVDAMNAQQPDPFNALVQQNVDFEEWTRVMALEHSVGNWDSYGYNRGKNMFAYKPQNGKWTLLAWDIDFVLDNGGDGPTTDLNPTTMPIGDPTIRYFFSFPTVQRAWWRALQDLANGPMSDARFSAMMNDKYQGLVNAGIPVNSPAGAIGYASSRRAYIQSLLSSVSAPFAVTKSFSTNRNYVTITGTAPINIKDIAINAVKYPVTWTSTTSWSATVALGGGANVLTLTGYDRLGNLISNTTTSTTITYTGPAERPQDHVVINEIMYNAALPNAGFVELYNTSVTNAFDLSGFVLNGADYTFPAGSVIAPHGFLVIAEDRTGFATAYGTSIPLVGTFNGTLKNSGETLQLVKPGVAPAPDLIIDEVTYDNQPPWPTNANGFGPSLQLIDPTQDNNRVANWSVGTTNIIHGPVPQWQYVTAPGTATSTKLYLYLNGPGDVYIDDIKLVAGSVAEAGANLLQDGDFESGLSPWQTTANTAASSVSSTIAHSGGKSLHLICANTGSTSTDCLLQDNIPMVQGSPYTLSFWYLQTTNAQTLTARISNSGIRVDQNIQMPGGGGGGTIIQLPATPGAVNSVTAATGGLPSLWLNEIQPNNASGPKDNAGDRDPWAELYNSGTTNISLAGYYLSDTYTNLTKWSFPAGATIAPGQYKLVWLDNETNETSGTNLHANFRASITNGSIMLTRTNATSTNVIDYLNYGFTDSNRSYGAFPNGTPTKRQTFYYATPGAPNTNTWPIAPIYINEWMASNTRTLVDPVGGKYSDWFELYNAGPDTVDLAGYYLANSLTNKTQDKVPAGYPIPSGGHLLVWADSNKNDTNDPALHVSFKLSASGETIALFSPVGALIDSVVFPQQTNDISQGRFPDGSSAAYSWMPTPTPGAVNILGAPTNHPPVLAVIPDQTAYQNSPLIFVASASDADAGQILTYSLDPGAPDTATINPNSGIFNWTSTQADPPGVYIVTVRVTDNGFPPASDARLVNINVINPPALKITSTVSVQKGTFSLNWPGQIGRTYRVSYKFNLEAPTWTTLTELKASTGDLSVTDEILSGARRFYRIELLAP